MAVEASVLLQQMRTRVVVRFEVGFGMGGGGVEAKVGVKCRVVYGEALKEGRMGEFVKERVGEGKGGGKGEGKGWVVAVQELEARCAARGKR